MGRPFPTPWTKGNPGVCFTGDLDVIDGNYTQALVEKFNSIHGDVSVSLPLPTEQPTHPFLPGDIVLVKSLKQ